MTAAGRAPVEVRAPRPTAVVRLQNPLRRQRRDVYAPIRVVDELLRVRRERTERLDCRIVTRIHLGRREAARERTPCRRDPSGRVERFASVAAVTEHVEPAVPRGGKTDLEADLGLNQSVDPTVLRRIGRCRDDRGGRHREFVRGERDEGRARVARCGLARIGEHGASPVLELRAVLRAQGCTRDSANNADECSFHEITDRISETPSILCSAASSCLARDSGNARAAHDRNFVASSSSLAGRSG